MKISTKFCKGLWLILFVLILFVSIISTYGDEQKKSEEVKKQAPPAEPIEKDKGRAQVNEIRNEQKSSIKRESNKKKVPAFWFLLPEK